MVFLTKMGVLPQNDGMTNAKAFQKAVSECGDFYLDEPGVYEIADLIYLNSHTHLYFCAGSVIKRVPCPDGNDSYLFTNRGAFTSTWDEDIHIHGLHLVCNGVYPSRDVVRNTKQVVGLSAQLAFSYVRDFKVTEFTVKDLPPQPFAIQLCTFEDAHFENIYIEGMKDGIHLGRGRRFTIRHGVFRTFDDPIALNAHDYSTSNPQMGWIEDGVIEDCYDLPQPDTTGFFCRILAGSWLPWKKGMVVQRSDSVVNNGRVYRVVMPPDGKTYISETAPCHEEGTKEYDGIYWAMAQADDTLSCGCRNIVFRDIHLQKPRPVAFMLHFDKDKYSRSYYPYSEAPVQDNITFENIWVEEDIPCFLKCKTPTGTVRINQCRLGKSNIYMRNVCEEGITYPRAQILMNACELFPAETPRFEAEDGVSADIYLSQTFPNDDSLLRVKGDIRVFKQ